MTRPRRLAALLAALLATAGASACGKAEQTGRVVRAENEGLYLDISELKYQVEASRQLNPDDVQDRPLLAGIPAPQAELKPDEVWFGVFVRVQNETERALSPASDIVIVDTQEHVYKPIALEPTNAYAYRSTERIAAGAVSPVPDSPAFDTPMRASLVLFKLTNQTLDNRPLELRIAGTGPPQQTGIIDIDV